MLKNFKSRRLSLLIAGLLVSVAGVGIYTYSANYVGIQIEKLVINKLQLEQHYLNTTLVYQRGVFSSSFEVKNSQGETIDTATGSIWHLGFDLNGAYSKLNAHLNLTSIKSKFDLTVIQHSLNGTQIKSYLQNPQTVASLNHQRLVTDILSAGSEIELVGGNKDLQGSAKFKTGGYEYKNGLSLVGNISLSADGEQDLAKYVPSSIANVPQVKITDTKVNLYAQAYLDTNLDNQGKLALNLNKLNKIALNYSIKNISTSPWFDSESYNFKDIKADDTIILQNKTFKIVDNLAFSSTFMDREQIEKNIANVDLTLFFDFKFDLSKHTNELVNIQNLLNNQPQTTDLANLNFGGKTQLKLSFSNDKGSSSIKLNYETKDLTLNTYAQDFFKHGEAGDLTANFNLPQLKSFLTQALPANKFKGLAKLANFQLNLLLNQGAKYKYLIQEGENYQLTGAIKNNALTINNQLISDNLSQFVQNFALLRLLNGFKARDILNSQPLSDSQTPAENSAEPNSDIPQ